MSRFNIFLILCQELSKEMPSFSKSDLPSNYYKNIVKIYETIHIYIYIYIYIKEISIFYVIVFKFYVIFLMISPTYKTEAGILAQGKKVASSR